LNQDSLTAEAQLRSLIDQAPVAVAMFDRHMRYVAVSSRWLRDYRIDAPVLGRSHYEIFPEIPEGWKDIHRRALAGETVTESEDRFDRADGAVQWLAWTVQPWIEPNGVIGGIIICSEDVTARKKADAERELFVAAVQSSRDFIGMCDAAFNPFFLNAAGMHMVGLSNLDEAKRTPVKEFFFPEDQDYIMNEFFPSVLHDGCGDVEIRFRHFKTGEALWMQYSVYSLTEVTSGRTSGYATVSRNITKQKAARQQLAEAQRRLQAIMNAAPVGLSYSDSPNCEHIKGNPALFAQFEISSRDNISASAVDPEAAGRQAHFFKDGREIANDELPLQRAIAEKQEIAPLELEVILPSGRRWWTEASGAPILDENGEVIGGVAVTVDVTERRQTQEALRVADRRKDEFLATLAHELRNPLAPISYGLRALRKGVKNEHETERLVAMMERQVGHLVRLVDELLDVARITSGKIELKKERVRLASIVNQSIETVENQIQSAGHQLTVSLSPEPLFVDGDPVRLAQVFGNLLTNAAKYTDPGGRIDLTLSREDDQAVVAVRDNGIGIPPTMLSSIFELFTQANVGPGKLREGMGVGLALTKRLVELHGGQIAANSAGVGCGSEFIVRVPVAAPGHSTNGPQEETSIVATPARRVLVVDDEKDVADSLVALLRHLGADAHAAYSGVSALEVIADLKPDLILLDIGMPGMDGYEAARRIRQLPQARQSTLAAVTGWGQAGDRKRALDAGFDRHFVKPIDATALAQLLRSPPIVTR
jgi:PAS domain S-box-containing protein